MKKCKYIGLIILSFFFLYGCTGITADSQTAQETMIPQDQQPQEEIGSVQNLSFVYYDGDSLNPLKSQGATNFGMKFLWCDAIIGLNEQQKPIEALAVDWELKGNKAILSLRDGVLFHDGSPFGAEDVVNTLNYIMEEPSSPYHAIADDILSVEATGPLTVEIILKKVDYGFFARLNIPVVKNPFDEELPIGTGKYILCQKQNRVVLTANEKWYGENIPNIKTIELRSYPDREAINFAFSTGEIDLLDKGILREGREGYYGASWEYTYTSQNLIFLSVNTQNNKLTAPVRSYLNTLIDRTKLTSGIQPVETPLFPNWWAVTQSEEAPVYITRTQRDEKFTELGFVDLNGDGIFDKEDGRTIQPFVLLANGDNVEKSEIALKISDQLRIMGFPITMETPDFEEYQQRLEEGVFDFAIVEVALNNSMDISPLVEEGGINNFGTFAGIKTQMALNHMKTAKNQEEYCRQGDLLYAALLEETPVIPLFYRKGMVSIQENISLKISPVVSDIFANIEKW
jgi:peptide/nickel transport system substrate-binding protein